MEPWLSVVMPARNGARWIAEALGSLAAEPEAAGVECIVVDGSDGPETREIAAGFADRLALRVLHRPDLGSWQEKTNHGFALARAPHLCTLHVDDAWLPGRAAALRAAIAAAPAAALHLNASVIIGADGRRLGPWRCPLPAGEVPRETVLARLLVQNFIAVPAPVFRRDAALALGGFDPALWYTADWDFWLRLGAVGGVRYDPAPRTAFRIHGTSLTVTGSRSLDDFAAQQRIVLDRHLGLVAEHERAALRRRAEASIAVNAALAGALNGGLSAVPRAAWQVARLGPRGAAAWLRDSRIVERLLPRLRARFTGGL